MNIIFLDIDGVLNSEKFYVARQDQIIAGTWDVEYPLSEFDPGSISILNSITDDNYAKLVLSSCWRIGKDIKAIKELFVQVGITGECIGKTMTIKEGYGFRGNEIHQWMQDNKDLLGESIAKYRRYVILDDDTDMLYWHRNNIVHVDRFVGLTKGDAYKCHKIFQW